MSHISKNTKYVLETHERLRERSSLYPMISVVFVLTCDTTRYVITLSERLPTTMLYGILEVCVSTHVHIQNQQSCTCSHHGSIHISVNIEHIEGKLTENDAIEPAREKPTPQHGILPRYLLHKAHSWVKKLICFFALLAMNLRMGLLTACWLSISMLKRRKT